MQKREKVLEEVDRLSQVDPRFLPERSRYLLEIDFSTPSSSKDLVKQQYWLYSMKAAVKAGKRAARRRHHATARDRRASRAATATRRRGRNVAGATSVWNRVLVEHGLMERPTRTRRVEEVSEWRASEASMSITRVDNKRRRPD